MNSHRTIITTTTTTNNNNNNNNKATATGSSRLMKLFFVYLLGITLPLLAVSLPQEDSPHQLWETRRWLAPGDFAAINAVLEDTEFQLPDMTSSDGSTSLDLSQIVCSGIQVEDVSLTSHSKTSGISPAIDVAIQVVDLDLYCSARYHYDGWLISGSGTVHVTSRNSDVVLQGSIAATTANTPPSQVSIQTCSPSVNINDIDFENGGFVGWVLNLVEGLARDMMESLVEDMLCSELQEAMQRAQEVLEAVKGVMDDYRDDGGVNALDGEAALVVPDDTRLLDLQHPQTTFGQWVNSTLLTAVDYLRQVVDDPETSTGSTDMRANIMIRQFLLEGGALPVDTSHFFATDNDGSAVVFYNHDALMETTILVNEVKLLGLDSLYQFDPLTVIGPYTVQSRLAWALLALEVDAIITVKPSSLDGAIVQNPSNAKLEENIQVVAGLGDLEADLALLSAFDQDVLEQLKLGSILRMDDLTPCLLSSIVELALTSFSIDAGDIFQPSLTGFVSEGLDRIFEELLKASFLLYEDIALERAPVYFQTDVRQLANERWLSDLSSSQICPDVANLSNDFIDFRDLLLSPEEAYAKGGSGASPYGDVVYSVLTPHLRSELLELDHLNQQIVGTMTSAQSGTVGTLVFDESTWQYETSSVLFETAVMHISNVQFQNLDTIAQPLSILDPEDWNLFSNIISLQSDSAPLTVSANVLLAVGDDASPLHMINQIDFSVAIPSVTLWLDVVARVREKELLNFPLTDLTNPYCWISAFKDSATDDIQPLDLRSLEFSIPSFSLDASCVVCSSPGTDYLPRILSDLEIAGFPERFNGRITDLVEELLWGFWDAYNLNETLVQGSTLCPHDDAYDPRAVVETQWPEVPTLSAASLETIFGGLLVTCQTVILISAKNYISMERLGELDTSPNTFGNLGDHNFANWVNLTSEMGEWADLAFASLRGYLSAPNSTTGSPVLVQYLEQHVLTDEGTYRVELPHLNISYMGCTIESVALNLGGLQTLSDLDILVPTEGHVLENTLTLDELIATLDVNLTIGESTEYLQFNFSIKDFSMKADMMVALDLDVVREIQIGSVFNMSQIFPCLASGLRALHLQQLTSTVGEVVGPTISGSLSDDFYEIIDGILTNLQAKYEADILEAFPLFLASTARDVVNSYLPNVVSSLEAECHEAPSYSQEGLVDLRDLLLPPLDALSFGASGGMPYGDLFAYLYSSLESNIMRPLASNRTAINDVFLYLTEEQSDIPGTFLFEGNVVDSQSRIKVAGLDADVIFRLSNVTIQNVDSVGNPLTLLQPMIGEPNSIENVLSFGINHMPLSLKATMLLSMSDGVGMDIQNELDVILSLEDVSMMAELLLLISETSFASFPIRDLNNINCWLTTLLSQETNSSTALRGIGLSNYSLSIGDFNVDLNCTSCSSPYFDELLLSLYDFENNTDLEETIRSQTQALVDSDFFPVLLDQVVEDSGRKCPHHQDYDPNAAPVEYLSSPADYFGLLEIASSSEKPPYFNMVNGGIAFLLFLIGILARIFMKRRNRKWVRSLSDEGTILLLRQQQKDVQMQKMLDETTESLFTSDVVPRRVRYGVPVALVLNTGLYLCGHFGTLSTVNIDALVAGQEFTIFEFLVFRFISSTRNTFQSGGAEMAVLLWLFTGLWPYIKLLLSVYVWVVPPSRLSVKRRGQVLLWIDALAKLSVIDICTMLMAFAVFLVFIGGPDKSFHADDSLYSFKAVVVPGVGFYCLLAAQRMSRVSSKFLLEYHEAVVTVATRKEEAANRNKPCSSFIPEGHQGLDDYSENSGLIKRPDDALPCPPSTQFENESVAQVDDDGIKLKEGDGLWTSSGEFRWGTLGVMLGGVTIFIVFVIGCIFAPAISFDASSFAGLAVESDLTYEDLAGEYGVFLVVSGILVEARFVLNSKADYIGLGLLLFGAVVSVAFMFLIQGYHFVKRKLHERKVGPIIPAFGHSGCGLPHYFQLYKWKHMEIFLISFAIGVWQLGSACAYAIHMYCDVLRQAYAVMAYLGMVEESTAQCSREQASLPGNLIIMVGAFIILSVVFVFQAAAQYRKNIADCLRWVDDDDVPRFSLAWSSDKSKNSRYSHLSSRFSQTEQLYEPDTPITAAVTPPGSPDREDSSSIRRALFQTEDHHPADLYLDDPVEFPSSGVPNPSFTLAPRQCRGSRFGRAEDDSGTRPPPALQGRRCSHSGTEENDEDSLWR
eukprot:Nitzschia sp. Nitz4//scaffold103_size77763//45581//52259//NITZ4_005447-RA/size77763-processed-gene-0.92-mRNA-1//-1//CDS//3329532334//6373//frame0